MCQVATSGNATQRAASTALDDTQSLRKAIAAA